MPASKPTAQSRVPPIRENSAAETWDTPSENVPISFSHCAPSPGQCRCTSYLFRTAITIALGALCRQQTWRQRRSGSRKRLENEKIGMGFRRLRNLGVQTRDPLQQGARHSCDHLYHHPFGLDHGSIPNRRHGLTDPLQARLRELGMTAPMLAEELPHF